MKILCFFALCLSLLLLIQPTGGAQEPPATVQRDRIARGNELLRQTRYDEAAALFARWLEEEPQNPDAQYYLALTRGLQRRLDEALNGFRRVLELDPRRAEARFEIAGILLGRGEYREAFEHTREGLRLKPDSEYGLDLAGSLAFLMGDKVEALRYWNRRNRPRLTEMTIVSGPLDRYRVAEEIDLKPGDLLSSVELEKAAWRLSRHDYIRQVEFNPVPGPVPEQYALEVNVNSRRGFGGAGELLFRTLGEVAFETLHLSYWNMRNSGTTVHLPLRWNPEARFFGLELDSPRPLHYPVYVRAWYGWRDESWFLQRSGSSPSFRLRTHDLTTSVLLPLTVPQLAADVYLGYRWRNFSANSPAPAGTEREPDGVFRVGLAPELRILNGSSPVGWRPGSALKADFAWARLYNADQRYASRISASWRNRLERTSKAGRDTSLRLGLHAGWLSSQNPVEDYFLLGVGPDADFPLRAHPIFRDGRKGGSPMASRFALGNLSCRQDIYRWKVLRIGFLAFADAAQIWSRYSGQEGAGTLVDTGIGIEFGSSLISENRFTVAYGRDWKGERNTLYVGARFPW